jgi:hypothetical protein
MLAQLPPLDAFDSREEWIDAVVTRTDVDEPLVRALVEELLQHPSPSNDDSPSRPGTQAAHPAYPTRQ